jgi:hypothetical protein
MSPGSRGPSPSLPAPGRLFLELDAMMISSG